MKKPDNLAVAVANTIFAPTALCYVLEYGRYVFTGLTLYIALHALAYRMWLFEHFNEWPWISRVPSFLGPPMLGLGIYFSTQKPAWHMVYPAVAYCVLCVAAGLALMGKFNTRDLEG